MTRSPDQGLLAEASAALREANLAFARAHPGESAGRQPVHTVYGGAQLFAADSVPRLGALARRALDRYAPDPATLGRALDIADHPALDAIHARVGEKLAREPIEDFRIDFEDGYGNRPDPEEDGQGSDEHAGPQQHVEAERLTLEERVAGDSEEERRRNERDRDLISIAHRRAIQP